MPRLSTLLAVFLLGSLAMGAPQGVSIYKLNNGMDVLLIENKALPMVGVNVIIKTGSAYETYETSGMSHMLEHLLFNGTTSRTQRELYDDTDLIGGYNNANTGDYYTNFMMVMPAEHQVAGMELQADMLFNSLLPAEKFEKEKGIVLEEIAQSLSKPATQLDYNLAAELYKGHSLSLPTLGTYATIEHMQRDDVYHYYKTTYLPNNMILSAIGNFDSEAMLKEINRIYGAAAPGSIFRPADAVLKTGLSVPAGPGLTPGTWLDRYYSGDVPTLHQIYTLPLDMPVGFETLLQSAFKSILSEMEEDLKASWPDAIEGLEVEIHRKPIAAYLELKVNLKQESQAREINEELFKLVSKAKFRIPNATLNAMATKERTEFLQNTEKPHMFGIYNAYALSLEGIDGILALPEIEDISKAYMTLKNFRFSKEPAVIFQHAQGAMKSKTAGAVTTTLVQDPAEGMGLIVRQNTGSELLAIHYLFKHKTGFEAVYGEDAAQILHDCFGQRMEHPDKTELSQQYGLRFTVNDNPWIPMDNIYLHPDFGYIRVEGLADDLEGAINFLKLEMNNFIPTEAEYMQAKSKFSKGMMHGNTDKAKELFDTLVDSVLYGPKPASEEPEISYAGLVNFSKAYFAPVNRIVSVVSPASAELLGQELLTPESHGSSQDFPFTDKVYVEHSSAVALEQQGGGERSYLFWGFTREIDPADKAAVQALGLILSDRITFDVREKQGMAYRMTATASIKGNKALFYISLGTRPQNAAALVPQFPELMSTATLSDLTQQDVQKTINMYLGRMMFRRLSSINQAFYLGFSLFFEGDMNADEADLKALSTVTLEDVQRVAHQYLSAGNTLSIVVH